MGGRPEPLRTLDGRYIVVDGVLWRGTNPRLSEDERERHVRALMDARRAVGTATRVGNAEAERHARAAVHEAKVALGERGPVWWFDGAPDLNRRQVEATDYAGWWAVVSSKQSCNRGREG